jgi:hypothetical protein
MHSNVKLDKRVPKSCTECSCVFFQTQMQMTLPQNIGNELICDECDVYVNGKHDEDDSFVYVKGID